MSNKLYRVSVAVDEKTRKILEDIAKKENKTLSEVMRQAILVYSKVKDLTVLNEIENFAEILSKSNNIIIDIELWLTFLDELNRCGSDRFWETVERIGYEHGLELKSRGIRDIEEVLKVLSFRNFFEFDKKNDNYTLILTTRSEVRFLKVYLIGLFKSLGIERNFDLVEGLRKIIILTNKCLD